MSNSAMPGLLKVGMTDRSPEERLSDANSSDTWRPPVPYKVEIAKKVLRAREKEGRIHKLLEKYTERVNPKREFFRATVEQIAEFFSIIDGEDWVQTDGKADSENDSVNDNSPNIGDGTHIRLNKATGNKVKCKYVFPYASDGGRSVVNDLVENTPILGVSTTQKNNNKEFCKVADYQFIWINNKTVKDISTNIIYPHKEGRVVIKENDSEIKLRLMWDIVDL
jgi:hypothetical protein